LKLPKTKTGLCVVERVCMGAEGGVPVGIFVTEEAADNYGGSCEQEFKDKGITAYWFITTYVMFYNE
jgi:hypothetical protein